MKYNTRHNYKPSDIAKTSKEIFELVKKVQFEKTMLSVIDNGHKKNHQRQNAGTEFSVFL
jgi:hypothetical protein